MVAMSLCTAVIAVHFPIGYPEPSPSAKPQPLQVQGSSESGSDEDDSDEVTLTLGPDVHGTSPRFPAGMFPELFEERQQLASEKMRMKPLFWYRLFW
ncbi:hypothetical protein E2C01_097252 [Portunus trituberculatus]|uniref:Uncharacterized protein n=2 Tax=Portunus trituberculatus TaxID=210409 RepID=A0A5B7JUP5_PORTR|nr:hypothetical protein [Portunus trituberculatus]